MCNIRKLEQDRKMEVRSKIQKKKTQSYTRRSQMQYINSSAKSRQSRIQTAEPKVNREFHNVNGRFCGAIHNVDRTCISVLSQVIYTVFLFHYI